MKKFFKKLFVKFELLITKNSNPFLYLTRLILEDDLDSFEKYLNKYVIDDSILEKILPYVFDNKTEIGFESQAKFIDLILHNLNEANKAELLLRNKSLKVFYDKIKNSGYLTHSIMSETNLIDNCLFKNNLKLALHCINHLSDYVQSNKEINNQIESIFISLGNVFSQNKAGVEGSYKTNLLENKNLEESIEELIYVLAKKGYFINTNDVETKTFNQLSLNYLSKAIFIAELLDISEKVNERIISENLKDDFTNSFKLNNKNKKLKM